MSPAQDTSKTSGNNEEMIYEPGCGMSKEEFEWRRNQYKMVDQRMPHVLDELKIQSQRMRSHFLDDPDALAKWNRYESDVRAAFASNLKRSMWSPLRLPNSVLYKHLMKRKIHSKSFVGTLLEGLDKHKRIVGAGAISVAAGIAVGFVIGPACWDRWKQH